MARLRSAWMLSAGLFLIASGSSALEPTPPIRLVHDGDDVAMEIDAAVGELTVSEALFRSEKAEAIPVVTRERRLDARELAAQKDARLRLRAVLGGALSGLSDGYYSERFEVRAKASAGARKAFDAHTWRYFRVSKGEPVAISGAAYSAATDPVVTEKTPSGALLFYQLGGLRLASLLDPIEKQPRVMLEKVVEESPRPPLSSAQEVNEP